MNKKKKFFFPLIAVALGFMALKIDRTYFMSERVQGQIWESRGGKDYRIVGKDLITYKQDFETFGDTILLKSGKKYLIIYCIFDNFWISTLDKKETAWYVGTMSSEDW